MIAARPMASPKYVLYLAVLPFYRQECMRSLSESLGQSLAIYAGDAHLDRTIRTGIDPELYVRVRNVSLAGKILLQLGHWRAAVRAQTTILDLNPRSLSAWVLLALRRVLRRRTLLWGHLNPRAGSQSKTVKLRDFMRGMADGTVLYGYDSVVRARQTKPNLPVWVAPNSLYRAADMVGAIAPAPSNRVLYVGRLVASKKVELVVRALSTPVLRERNVVFDVVGSGDERDVLIELARQSGVSDRVNFLGTKTDVRDLRSLYEAVACAVSPGYAGLNLTQSLGFGVPIVVADDEPHAPEIELVRLGGVTFFASGSADSLGEAIAGVVDNQEEQDRSSLADIVRSSYSAESMADGLRMAFTGDEQTLLEDGWPPR